MNKFRVLLPSLPEINGTKYTSIEQVSDMEDKLQCGNEYPQRIFCTQWSLNNTNKFVFKKHLRTYHVL